LLNISLKLKHLNSEFYIFYQKKFQKNFPAAQNLGEGNFPLSNDATNLRAVQLIFVQFNSLLSLCTCLY